MQVENKKDVRLLGRAIREGWPMTDDKRKEVLAALMEVVENRDPDLMMDAIDRLLRADEINVKREAIQQKQSQQDDNRKLQLIALAQRLGIGSVDSFDSTGIGITQDVADEREEV